MSCFHCMSCCDGFATLSGVVSNAQGPVAGVTILYTACCFTATTQTDANGQYTIMTPRGCPTTIIPQVGMGVVVTPSEYSVCCADRSDLNFLISAMTPSIFTVSGMLTGLPATTGLMVSYTANGVPAVTPVNAGVYSFSAPANAAVTITPPAVPGFTVAPASISIPNLGTNMTGQNFTYTPIP